MYRPRIYATPRGRGWGIDGYVHSIVRKRIYKACICHLFYIFLYYKPNTKNNANAKGPCPPNR